ncbi:MFS transporter [Kineococcus sp. SYSU DK002]|uniref:MFS transporter n=1 Tax=Kineococcus sp. SYSU DK002 TaxID=3383123 RepID=UPI003D7E1DF7
MGPASTSAQTAAPAATNPVGKVAAASLIGTTIEFYDFYVYATAAVLVFPALFFPSGNDTAATLASLATFAIAFVARPIGSICFGHFGDRIGRKTTLVAALLVMGVSTVLIGVLPTHASIGNLAPALLCLLRFGQGFGLGGEWGGAALLATENAPANRRALYGMFPQLGAPFGFIIANTLFIVLATNMSDETFMSWGWRVPFLLSALLVVLGLWIRLSLSETPIFAKALAENKQVRVPVAETFRRSGKIVVLGAFSVMLTYTLFYLTTTWSLSYGTKTLTYERQDFLLMLCVAVVFMAIGTPLSGILSDRFGRRPVLATAMVGGAVVGLLTGPLLGSGETWKVMVWLCAGLFFMGLVFGPIGAYLPELFPTNVRYTGASLAFNSGSILGASLAPYTAVKLAAAHDVSWVGYYLAGTAVVSLIALALLRETRTASIG